MNESRAGFAIRTPIDRQQAASMHPMALAFVGDAVHTLYVRTLVTEMCGGPRTGELHRMTSEKVAATAQAAASGRISPLFDETEADIFRRGRNWPLQTPAKHAPPAEDRRASGLGTGLGDVYLTGQAARLSLFLGMATEDKA